jgi:hypothetical protein
MASFSGAASRGGTLSPATIDALRPHLVDLTRGRLSTGGLARTTRQDVERIFREHLPAFVEQRGGADVPVVVWAHGGLVDEASGLAIAQRHVGWWLANGVFPIYFVWETGLSDALNQLFASFVGGRGVIEDATDRLVEWTGHHLGGVSIWGAMKSSAELAVGSDGGARLVAELLGEFVQAHPGAVRLHAVGHSAGSILHRWFLPVAVQEQARFSSLSLLAPAVRTDELHTGLEPLLGHGVDRMVMFTMDEAHERADVCAAGSFAFYHHSLLMLIKAALEDREGTPILGLQESVRADAALAGLFGSGGSAEVVWSPTDQGAPLRAASTATSHGGFDDDPATMESLAHRITGRSDVVDYPSGGWRQPDVIATPAGITTVGPVAPAARPAAGGGPRRALCVGIDAYPAPNRLGGCVADSQAWAAALRARGFDVAVLTDGQATRQAIVDGLASLIASSVSGDVIVFQYAGHGTYVPDTDGDEEFDQALCPVDFATGALLIDDDLRELIAALPDGVNLTCFLDSCHSATATREVVLALREQASVDPGTPRFVVPDDALVSAHQAFRGRSGPGAAPGTRGPAAMREVTFSACLQTEVAYETGGRGDYSRIAVPLLAAGPMTNRVFQDRVETAFGGGRQHPYLDSPPTSEDHMLLEPSTAAPHPGGHERPPEVVGRERRAGATAALLRALADVIDA